MLTTFVPPAGSGDAAAGGGLPEVRTALLSAINAAHRGSARSRQTAIGPSQYGHPCGRHLVYMASGWDRSGGFTDPWPSILGTAGHAWLDTALRKANAEGRQELTGSGDWCPAYPRSDRRQRHNSRDDLTCATCRKQLWTAPTWITEQRVTVAPGLSGQGDAFHVPTGTVVDFKILGGTKFTELRKTPPESNYWTKGDGQQYFRQIQGYGLGFINAGYAVNHVALAIFGRSKRLSDMYLITWPFDRAVVTETLGRLDAARTLAAAGVAPLAVPARPSTGACFFCPFKGAEAKGLCEKGKN